MWIGRSSAFGRGVEGDGGADEGFQGLLVDGFAFVEVDGAAGVSFEAGVEEAGGVGQGGALGEGGLDGGLVGLAGADDPGVGPHRNAAPLPLLDDLRIGLADEAANPGEGLAAPVVQGLDLRVYELGDRKSTR